MKTLSLIATAGLLTISLSAVAGNKWTGETTITSLMSNANGSLYISLEKKDLPYVAGCTDKTALYLNGIKSAGAKGMHADMLAAQISVFKVNIGVDDADCSSGYRVISAVKVLGD